MGLRYLVHAVGVAGVARIGGGASRHAGRSPPLRTHPPPLRAHPDPRSRVMSAVSEQALLDAPASAVWELVGDPRRYPEWLPRVSEIQGESFEEGAEHVQVSRQPLSAASRRTSSST